LGFPTNAILSFLEVAIYLINDRNRAGLFMPEGKLISGNADTDRVSKGSSEIETDGCSRQAAHFHKLYR
jgi:hypothetical protein